MANHLNLKNAYFELGELGCLSIFSNGKSIILSTAEIQQVLSWFSQQQREKQLSIGVTRFELDTYGGLRIFLKKGVFLSIPPKEVAMMTQWLKQHWR